MTDAAGLKYERPLLRIFDDVAHDKNAHPIFKAYLFQQLGVVLKVRPFAWGLEYCPSLRDDLATLDRLCDNSFLRSQDWLLERKRTQLIAKLAPFFNGLQQRNYFAEAQLHREVLRAVVKAGLQSAALSTAPDAPHLLGEARSAHGPLGARPRRPQSRAATCRRTKCPRHRRRRIPSPRPRRSPRCFSSRSIARP